MSVDQIAFISFHIMMRGCAASLPNGEKCTNELLSFAFVHTVANREHLNLAGSAYLAAKSRNKHKQRFLCNPSFRFQLVLMF